MLISMLPRKYTKHAKICKKHHRTVCDSAKTQYYDENMTIILLHNVSIPNLDVLPCMEHCLLH